MSGVPWNRFRTSSLAAGGLFPIGALSERPRGENEAAIRNLCANVYLGENTALCRILGRYKAFVDTSDIYISPHLMLDGYWEMWVTEIIPSFVRPDMTVIDIGANLGYFTVLLADLVGPNGRVHAFEPNPPIFERLQKTIAINGFSERTTIHTCALSDIDGEVVHLWVPPDGPGGAFTYHSTGEGDPRAAHSVEVRTQRLDGLGIDEPGFIKIDVEGAEESIWRGMENLLGKPGSMTIALEFETGRYTAPGEFLNEITRFGFSLAKVDPDLGLNTVTNAELLGASPHDIQMLILRR